MHFTCRLMLVSTHLAYCFAAAIRFIQTCLLPDIATRRIHLAFTTGTTVSSCCLALPFVRRDRRLVLVLSLAYCACVLMPLLAHFARSIMLPPAHFTCSLTLPLTHFVCLLLPMLADVVSCLIQMFAYPVHRLIYLFTNAARDSMLPLAYCARCLMRDFASRCRLLPSATGRHFLVTP